MAGNTFGTLFRLTTFGESHGAAIGGIIDGCPAGLEINLDFIQKELDRRKPGQSYITTQRKEEDKVNFLSGIFEGKSTGHPIGFTIENTNQKPNDYEHIKDAFRPSHADFTYQEKYGIRDYRGGGRSSARETACRIVGGAIAKLYLSHLNISIHAYVSQVGPIKLEKSYKELDLTIIEESIIRCPDPSAAYHMVSYIEDIRKEGDTIGGIVSCVVKGTPVGLGEPVFDKLHADLGKAMLSINAVKGFEYGEGFNSVNFRGSEMNDSFVPFDSPTLVGQTVQSDKKIKTSTNHSGGIQGGISNGEDIYFNVAFKPVATIMQYQQSVDTSGKETTIKGKGRHDPCVLPRAVPIVESMAALVLVDHVLRNKTTKI